MKKVKFLLYILVGILSFAYVAHANSSGDFDSSNLSSQNSDTSEGAQEKIAGIFSSLETVGNSYNSGGGSAAALSMIDVGCRAALNRALETKLYDDVKNKITPNFSQNSVIGNYVKGKLGGLSQNSMNQLCSALKGEQVSSPNFQGLQNNIKNDMTQQALLMGQGWANASGLPFLSNLEIEIGTSHKSPVGSITSIQPLWQDENDLHHFFAQLSWYKAPNSLNEQGAKDKLDTYNAGMAYRYLTPNKKYIYGANVFFDYSPKKDHTRMSVGVDARTSQLAMSANRYFPISSWRTVDSYYEERASSGTDIEFRGQVPDFPSWTAIAKGYEWDSYTEGEKVYGAQAALEYSPVPALAVRVGVRDESEGSASVEGALRFNYRFDQPQDLQFKQRTALTPVADYVYEKVQRDNVIRVKQQRKASSKVTVTQTSGVNTVLEATGSSSPFVGQSLLMPVTLTTANTVGAILRVVLSDGSTLTLGQDSQATITPTLITLVSGSMEYVSNGIIHIIAVPGGTVVLHGTDLDIVATGASSSSVRVRDGAVTFTGTSSGSVELTPEELAQSVNGVIGTELPMTDPVYVAHADEISSEIDRVADPLNGIKVAPYPYESPRIVSESMTPGQQIVLGLRFNDEVTISGGTPQLNITINGNVRTVPLSAGSGTNDLQFAYTVQPTDAGATSILVTGLDKNGASIMGNGKDAVTTIADKTLPLSGSVSDVTAPAAYLVAFTTDPVNLANYTAASFQFTAAEVGSSYAYTISSSGGGVPVTGAGTIATATDSISGINLTPLGDGTLTVSVVLTDTSGNAGVASTDTVIKDIVAPTITLVSVTDATYEP